MDGCGIGSVAGERMPDVKMYQRMPDISVSRMVLGLFGGGVSVCTKSHTASGPIVWVLLQWEEMTRKSENAERGQM